MVVQKGGKQVDRLKIDVKKKLTVEYLYGEKYISKESIEPVENYVFETRQNRVALAPRLKYPIIY